MPTKYRKSVWIKRGDYCVVEAIEEGDKVKAEIVRILYKEQIRYIKSENSWPFKDNTMSEDTNERGDNDDSSDNDDDLFQNTNHQSAIEHSESSEDEDSDAK
jgi:probable RNA-binding protein EIF1AD